MPEPQPNRTIPHEPQGRVADGSTADGAVADAIAIRRKWFSVLSGATVADLDAAWQAAGCADSPTWLRAPETGLVMVRGRMGATGAPFHLGEMTATRCVVTVGQHPAVGYGCVAGRDARKAELVALFDALLQREPVESLREGRVWTQCIAPLARRQEEAASRQAERVASTKVEFFTMVRGEG